MENVIVRRIVENLVQLAKGVREDQGGLLVVEGFHLFEAGRMGLGKNPRLKKETVRQKA